MTDIGVSVGRSRLAYVFLGAVLGLILGLSWLLGLGFLGLVVLVAAFVGLAVLASHRPSVSVLTCQGVVWQCLVQTRQGDELWQGRLAKVRDYGVVLVLEFAINEPFVGSFRQVIYQDMMSANEFCWLRAAVRFG